MRGPRAQTSYGTVHAARAGMRLQPCSVQCSRLRKWFDTASHRGSVERLHAQRQLPSRQTTSALGAAALPDLSSASDKKKHQSRRQLQVLHRLRPRLALVLERREDRRQQPAATANRGGRATTSLFRPVSIISWWKYSHSKPSVKGLHRLS